MRTCLCTQSVCCKCSFIPGTKQVTGARSLMGQERGEQFCNHSNLLAVQPAHTSVRDRWRHMQCVKECALVLSSFSMHKSTLEFNIITSPGSWFTHFAWARRVKSRCCSAIRFQLTPLLRRFGSPSASGHAKSAPKSGPSSNASTTNNNKQACFCEKAHTLKRKRTLTVNVSDLVSVSTD